MARSLLISVVASCALVMTGAPAAAQWSVRELPGPAGTGPAIEMSYRSSGERLTLLCSAGAAFVSFAPGYRLPAQPEGVFDGSYSVDNGPAKPIRWRVTGTSAFVTARFAESFLADIAGAMQVFIQFPGVEQTYDLSALAPHARKIKSVCRLLDGG